jgi:antitoxin CcdA
MRMRRAHAARTQAGEPARKSPTNLSVRPDLVRRAKALGVNLSELLEAALTRAIAEKERSMWLAENEQAIDEYNAQVAKRGVFSDDWRRF